MFWTAICSLTIGYNQVMSTLVAKTNKINIIFMISLQRGIKNRIDTEYYIS